jgi:hypothetical protein
VPVLIHFRAAAEFDPAQFAAKSFFIREHLPGVGNNVRRKSGLFLQFFQSAWDQRQAHRIQGEHEETPTFNSFWCIDWFKRSEPQSGCLKARAKLGNPMPPVSFAKQEMTSTLVFTIDVQGAAVIFSGERTSRRILRKRSMLYILCLITPLHKSNLKCLFLSYWCRVPSSS